MRCGGGSGSWIRTEPTAKWRTSDAETQALADGVGRVRAQRRPLPDPVRGRPAGRRVPRLPRGPRMTLREDPLGPVEGILSGVSLGAALWVLIIAAIFVWLA